MNALRQRFSRIKEIVDNDFKKDNLFPRILLDGNLWCVGRALLLPIIKSKALNDH